MHHHWLVKKHVLPCFIAYKLRCFSFRTSEHGTPDKNNSFHQKQIIRVPTIGPLCIFSRLWWEPLTWIHQTEVFANIWNKYETNNFTLVINVLFIIILIFLSCCDYSYGFLGIQLIFLCLYIYIVTASTRYVWCIFYLVCSHLLFITDYETGNLKT